MTIAVLSSKAPLEILDYQIDITAELAGRNGGVNDTISSVLWVVPLPLTLQTQSFNVVGTATVWLAGGQTGSHYTVTAEIQTAGGREYVRSFRIYVENH